MSAINVCVTGGAGRIAYALIPLLVDGNLFNEAAVVNLRLLDIEGQEQRLDGLVMEILDSTFPNLGTVVGTTDPIEAFRGADVAILLGGFPRLKGMERGDLIAKNIATLLPQAEALNVHAKKNCLVVVVANPANTNCLVALSVASSLPAGNFSCLTRLDHERLRGLVAEKLKETEEGDMSSVRASDIRNLAIFGNHSSTQVPFIGAATYSCTNTEGQIRSGNVEDKLDAAWVKSELIPRVQKRGAEVIGALGASSALSAAQAIRRHVACILLNDERGNPRADVAAAAGDSFSMGCLCGKGDTVGGRLEMPADLVFSVPYAMSGSSVAPVSMDVPAEDLSATLKELLEEATTASQIVEKMGITLRTDCGLVNVVPGSARL